MECEERMWRIAKRDAFPKQLRLDGGSDWLVLHREFAEYSISHEELPAKMRKLFSSIILPVESFFHTVSEVFLHILINLSWLSIPSTAILSLVVIYGLLIGTGHKVVAVPA